MRKKLFENIYKLLKEVAPDMFQEQDYYLLHDFKDSIDQRIVIEYYSDNMIQLGTYFTQNGDCMMDPCMVAVFDNEKQMARISEYELSSISLYYCFDSEIDEEEKNFEEKDSNNYLEQYLKELKSNLKSYKNLPYFEKVKIKRSLITGKELR